jgi:hypothetical protein
MQSCPAALYSLQLQLWVGLARQGFTVLAPVTLSDVWVQECLGPVLPQHTYELQAALTLCRLCSQLSTESQLPPWAWQEGSYVLVWSGFWSGCLCGRTVWGPMQSEHSCLGTRLLTGTECPPHRWTCECLLVSSELPSGSVSTGAKQSPVPSS